MALAATLIRWGRCHEARPVLAEIATSRTQSAMSRTMLGRLLLAVGDGRAAIVAFTASANEGSLEAQRLLALALREQGEYSESLIWCGRALERVPDDLEVLLVRCLDYASLHDARFEDAAADVLRRDPDNAVTLFALGLLRKSSRRFEEAIELLVRAVALDPSQLPHGGAIDLANAYNAAGYPQHALRVLEDGLVTHPDPELHRALGQQLLRCGRFREGWLQHEFRWFIPPLHATRMRGDMVAWEGEPLAGKRILLRLEQGFGDAIQFMRYAPSLKALGATVVLGPIELAERYSGVDEILARESDLAGIDCYINLMSLPRVFGTELQTIPCPIPYVRASARHTAKWQDHFPRGSQPRVGIVWRGNPAHVADADRSIPLTLLTPILSVTGVAFVSLQRETRDRGATAILEHHGVDDLGPMLETYDDTAAVIRNLDLVIAVDTSVAHLAGALGAPVWTMLAKPSDWRWLEGRVDTPWYPSMRLFRQSKAGDWGSVISEVADALEKWCTSSFSGSDRAGRHGSGTVSVASEHHVDPLRRYGDVFHRHDVLLEYVPDHGPVEHDLERADAYLPMLMQLLGQLPLEGGVAVEANAAPGHHTVPIARMVGERTGHVLAFESRRRMARLLAENLRANDIRNVSVLPRRLRGTCTEKSEASDSVDDLGLGRLDLLKLDAAHGGLDVLVGAEQSLWRLRPRLGIETESEETSLLIGSWLRDRAYRTWRVSSCEPGNPGCVVALPEESSDVERLLLFQLAEFQHNDFR